MTKQEILQPLSVHYGWTDRQQQRIEDAMDEYAKQEAIAFYMFGVTRAFKLEEKETLTPDELYELYLKSK